MVRTECCLWWSHHRLWSAVLFSLFFFFSSGPLFAQWLNLFFGQSPYLSMAREKEDNNNYRSNILTKERNKIEV